LFASPPVLGHHEFMVLVDFVHLHLHSQYSLSDDRGYVRGADPLAGTPQGSSRSHSYRSSGPQEPRLPARDLFANRYRPLVDSVPADDLGDDIKSKKLPQTEKYAHT
jgi:hypothetical protein